MPAVIPLSARAIVIASTVKPRIASYFPKSSGRHWQQANALFSITGNKPWFVRVCRYKLPDTNGKIISRRLRPQVVYSWVEFWAHREQRPFTHYLKVKLHATFGSHFCWNADFCLRNKCWRKQRPPYLDDQKLSKFISFPFVWYCSGSVHKLCHATLSFSSMMLCGFATCSIYAFVHTASRSKASPDLLGHPLPTSRVTKLTKG